MLRILKPAPETDADSGHWLPLGNLYALMYLVGKIFSLPLK